MLGTFSSETPTSTCSFNHVILTSKTWLLWETDGLCDVVKAEAILLEALEIALGQAPGGPHWKQLGELSGGSRHV